MKTDDLITLLSNDSEHIERPKLYLFFGLGTLSLILTLAYFYVSGGLKLRPDYFDAIQSLPPIAKQLLPFLTVFLLYPAIKQLAYPDSRQIFPVTRIAPYVLGMGVLFVIALFSQPSSSWITGMLGKSKVMCLTYIPLLSLPPLALLLFGMRRAAPSQPMVTGFWLGILSSVAATSLYAFSCTEDSALFFAIWYSLCIVIIGVVGAVVGRYVLTW